MKHLLLLILAVFTINVKAQTPSVKKLVDLVKTHHIDSVTAYADKLGYVKGLEVPEIGNMSGFAITSFIYKDTIGVKSTFSYSAGRPDTMDQGPLTVSLSFHTPLKAEFDILVAEIKALGAKEIATQGVPSIYHFKYGEVTISSVDNISTSVQGYTISVNCVFW
jgi:hypothetical protein